LKLAIVRVVGRKPLENIARLGVTLLLYVELRQGDACGTRLRNARQKPVQEADGTFRRTLGENVRLDQRRTFPARLERERAVGSADRR
jgi:hypothetical protein